MAFSSVSIGGGEAELGETHHWRFGFQQPHDDFFAVLSGQGGDAEVHLALADDHQEAPILRRPALGNVHVGQDLDARDERVLDVARHSAQVSQHAVHAQPHGRIGGLRLDVDVAGLPRQRGLNDFGDHVHRGRALLAHFGLHFLENLPVGLARGSGDELACRPHPVPD